MPKRTNDGLKKRCDCARRNWPKCSHPWHFSFHHAGVEHRYSLDKIARARGEHPPATKTDAETWRDRLRGEIRAGTFVDPDAPVTVPVQAEARLTFGDVVTQYRTQYVNVPTRRASAAAMFKVHLKMLCRADVPAAQGATIKLRDKPIDAITKADVEAIRSARRVALAAAQAARKTARTTTEHDADRPAPDPAIRRTRRPGSKGGEVGINRLLARLRHVFSWAIEAGHTTETPFKRAGVTVVHLDHKAETARTRRLQPGEPVKPGEEAKPGEEERLLKHADPHLRALIVAALSTGCRLGELLSLQWAHVRCDEQGEPQALSLAAARTKTNTTRTIPVGPRLRAELAMRRHAPDGKEHPPTAHVFGNEVSEEVTSIREAWEQTCAAAGITDLHFHDLRREFACRLLESSADLHDVRDFLGHANITTTSAYLASSPVRLARALARMEGVPTEEPSEETPPDSHTVRTNQPEDTNGRPQRPAVIH